MTLPRYPIYIISKGRADCCLTARFLIIDEVPFHIVVEPQEYDLYAKEFGAKKLIVTPFSNLGLGGIPARNFVWEHAKAAGHCRHWILDDNSRGVHRRYKAMKVPCNSSIAFAAIEDFVDRYENIAIAGMNYSSLIPDEQRMPPFFLNVHVYSCLLILNSLTQRWRGRYNEDTDLCLQVLADKWCTVLFNSFLIQKVATMTMKGGNAAELYKGDGRLKMARALERMWPNVASVGRRFQRPQHMIRYSWGKFDTKLKLKPGIKIPTDQNEYGMTLKVLKKVKSKRLKQILGIDAGTN